MMKSIKVKVDLLDYLKAGFELTPGMIIIFTGYKNERVEFISLTKDRNVIHSSMTQEDKERGGYSIIYFSIELDVVPKKLAEERISKAYHTGKKRVMRTLVL